MHECDSHPIPTHNFNGVTSSTSTGKISFTPLVSFSYFFHGFESYIIWDWFSDIWNLLQNLNSASQFRFEIYIKLRTTCSCYSGYLMILWNVLIFILSITLQWLRKVVTILAWKYTINCQVTLGEKQILENLKKLYMKC